MKTFACRIKDNQNCFFVNGTSCIKKTTKNFDLELEGLEKTVLKFFQQMIDSNTNKRNSYINAQKKYHFIFD